MRLFILRDDLSLALAMLSSFLCYFLIKRFLALFLLIFGECLRLSPKRPAFLLSSFLSERRLLSLRPDCLILSSMTSNSLGIKGEIDLASHLIGSFDTNTDLLSNSESNS